MKVLDLYCGMGGWSDGFASEGFECVGVDIVNVDYPYQLILQDVRTLDGKRLSSFDVIVGSPPCREFCMATNIGKTRWVDPPNKERGLQLVDAFLRIVEEAKPRYWLMENVPGLVKYLSLKPMYIPYLAPTMKRAFWGEFPLFLIQQDLAKSMQHHLGGRYRSWRRAKIPFLTAQALARAIKQASKGG